MDRKAEKTDREVEVTFLTSLFVEATPESASYTVINETTGDILLGWTALTVDFPDTSVVITVPASLNLIRNRGNKVERIVVVVTTTIATEEFRYEIGRVTGL